MSHEFHSALSQDHEMSPEDYLEIVSCKFYIFKTVFKYFQIVQAFVFVLAVIAVSLSQKGHN